MPDSLRLFLPLFYSFAILAVVGGVVAFLLYRRRGKETLLPSAGPWVVPWNGWAVLVAFVAMIFVPTIVQLVLGETGFFGMLYGPDFPKASSPEMLNNPEFKQAANLRGLWSQTIAAPLIVLLILFGLRYGVPATPEQMGLSRKRLGANVALGYVGWLIVAPVAFVVFAVAIVLLTPNPDKHPLMDLGAHAGQLELAVFALQAAVLWPIVEELLFRGVLLAWLVQEPKATSGDDLILQPRYRGYVCITVALILSRQSSHLAEAIRAQQWDRLVRDLSPFLFIAALVPLYRVLPWSNRIQRWTGFASPRANQALIASAIFFASIHSSVWPTPIPLLVLGLGLGWLALRTRSIVPSIVVHGLFNGVAVIYQRIGGMG